MNRDLSKQFWYPLDGTKNSNSNSNSIFINFILKHVGIELAFKKINLQSFFYFKLFLCPTDVKRPKLFSDFTP